MTATRNAICLCADANMLIPALFVADAARSRSAGSANRYNVIIFSEPTAVTEAHRRWMEERGIELRDDFDAARLRNTWPAQGRITEASLIRLILAEYLAGRYDKLLYLDSDVSIHDDIGAIFSLDTGEFALAAATAARFLPGQTEAEREPALSILPPPRHDGALSVRELGRAPHRCCQVESRQHRRARPLLHSTESGSFANCPTKTH